MGGARVPKGPSLMEECPKCFPAPVGTGRGGGGAGEEERGTERPPATEASFLLVLSSHAASTTLPLQGLK